MPDGFEKCWRHALSPVSYLSLGPKVAGSADATALDSCVAVPLTHGINMDLRHFQDQAELLAEQQLQDCPSTDGTAFKHKWNQL